MLLDTRPDHQALRALQGRIGGSIVDGRLIPLAASALSQPQAPAAGIDDGLAWFVVYTSIRCEFRAATGLRELGYTVFVPTKGAIVKTGGSARRQHRALFPRYMFVAFDPFETCGDDIALVDGVVRLRRDINGVPVRVPVGLMVGLMVDEALGRHDVEHPEPRKPHQRYGKRRRRPRSRGAARAMRAWLRAAI